MKGRPLLLVLALLVAEGLLKAWAVATLEPGVNRPLIPGLLHLGFTLNPGMAWGLLGGFAAPLAVLRVLVGTGLVGALSLGRVPHRWIWPLALIAAGALGNGLDGLMRGAVVDYLTSPVLDTVSRLVSKAPFPIFNLSDVLVCAGTGAFFVLAWRQDRRVHPRGAQPQS